MKKLIIALAGLALSLASAETYGITLNDPSVIKGTELKVGEYKLDVKDKLVVISKGKVRLEVPVTVQTLDQKSEGTSIIYSHENGKHIVRAIRIGGTKTKLVFSM